MLEPRQLLAVSDDGGGLVTPDPVWSGYAQLIGQDTASTKYSTLTGKGQVIAEIDTGIDYTHPNLGGGFGKGFKVIGGYDFVDNDNDPRDHVEDGHGTEVAGMIAGSRFTQTEAIPTKDANGNPVLDSNGNPVTTQQEITYQGIAPDAKLVALRTGTAGAGFSDANLQRAFNWIVANYKTYGITIVNMSLGGGEYTEAQSQRIFRPQTNRLKSLGIAVIAAAGNEGDLFADTVSHPASEPSIYAIGSISADDKISYFSDRGAILDLLAPGEQVTTTKFGGGYSTVDGTSFSSPLVAGVFALIKQAGPNLSPNDVMSILRSSSNTQYDGDGDPGYISYRAYAQLDLPAAIALAKTRVSTATLDSFAASKTSTSSAAYDTTGVVHLAYYDTATHKLMYAARLTNDKWTKPIIVDNGTDVGQYASIAVDPTGKPAIAYFDSANQDMKYAWFSGEKWNNVTLDDKGSVGQYTSLAFTADANPAIAYYRKTSGDLRLETYDHTTGVWSRETLDSTGDVGKSTSIASFREKTNTVPTSADYYDTIAVAYADSTKGNLKYWSRGTPLTGTPYTSLSTVDDTSGVAHASLRLIDHDGVGEARIAYQDSAAADVKFAYRKNGTWKKVVVASGGTVGASVNSYGEGIDDYHVVYFDSTKKATYDATIDDKFAVDHITRIGTLGSMATVASSSDGVNATLIGLNGAGKSIDDYDLL